MSDHYYSPKPGAAHQEQTIRVELRGRSYAFVTDAGVFSKKGVDYGSKLLIETMILPDRARVLDVGCGYGPIGLAAAALVPEGRVTMLDINERAVSLARRNAEQNNLRNVEIVQSDLLEAVQGRAFEVVLTNPPIRAGKEIVHRIFEQAAEALTEGGALWVVIQKKQGAPSARAKLESLFRQVEEVERDKGYWILRAIK